MFTKLFLKIIYHDLILQYYKNFCELLYTIYIIVTEHQSSIGESLPAVRNHVAILLF